MMMMATTTTMMMMVMMMILLFVALYRLQPSVALFFAEALRERAHHIASFSRMGAHFAGKS
jgi:hypothetical protein